MIFLNFKKIKIIKKFSQYKNISNMLNYFRIFKKNKIFKKISQYSKK